MLPQHLSDEDFKKLVVEGMDAIPKEFIDKIKNVAIVIADSPSPQQLGQVDARHGVTLLGLYEGIPQTQRGDSYSGVLPDKITIFKIPSLRAASDFEDLRAQVKNTVWHEIAHHFGLDHDRIHELENRG